MPSLVERTREVTANESDDYFGDDTILFYLNKTQERIVAYLLNLEVQRNKSIRALDNLRQKTDISVSGLTFTDQGNYFSAEVQFPSTDPINKFMYLSYDGSGVMRELTFDDRSKLDWGNLSPTDDELYYMVIQDDSENTVFEIFTQADDSGTSKNVRVYYVLNPTDLVLADETMAELPDRLENALVYGAAKMMITQEAINDQNAQNATQLFNQQFQEEIEVNAY